ncbi:MAG: hypothetical protein ACP5SH_15160, partial [Syntrophobacteraceae bacterium]
GSGGGGSGGGGGRETTAVNNLSFPAIAVDGFVIVPVPNPKFEKPYDGTYPGLTADAIALLQASGPWYAQKEVENVWQADAISVKEPGTITSVTYIDWGDNIESVNPKVGAPFRIEVTLYKNLDSAFMTGYTMAALEYPSSSNELQGTNTTTYQSPFATVISAKPKLVIQYLGQNVPKDMLWIGTEWTASSGSLPISPVTFAPELNVSGKYVFGASESGWKPTSTGYYRLTFYIPAQSSGISLVDAQIANYATNFTPVTEGTAATPVVDKENNLTYVDVRVLNSGGKGGGRK